MDLTKRLPHAAVLNNMKTAVGIAAKDAPASAGAPDELRLMNGFYPSLSWAPNRRPVRSDILVDAYPIDPDENYSGSLIKLQ
jgi:hypothetical protein